MLYIFLSSCHVVLLLYDSPLYGLTGYRHHDSAVPRDAASTTSSRGAIDRQLTSHAMEDLQIRWKCAVRFRRGLPYVGSQGRMSNIVLNLSSSRFPTRDILFFDARLYPGREFGYEAREMWSDGIWGP